VVYAVTTAQCELFQINNMHFISLFHSIVVSVNVLHAAVRVVCVVHAIHAMCTTACKNKNARAYAQQRNHKLDNADR
jgi:hypothetical protein